MNRSPLFYPMNRGSDNEAGGAGELQTDVMRFMAILSLCLVAIFALVQTIPADERRPDDPVAEPATPAPRQPDALVTNAEPEPVAEEPVVLQAPQEIDTEPLNSLAEPIEDAQPREPPVIDAADVDLQYPSVARYTPKAAPDPTPTETPEPAATVEPADSTATAAASAAVTREPAVPAQAQQGFSLRFEDDLALTRLVSRNEVGMYALSGDNAMRMNVNRGAIGFWAASSPNRFHEMEPSTVPQPVLDAYRHSSDGASVKWGVTLPPGMSRQLDEYLSQHSGGAIVIAADGALRLEQ